MIAALKRLYGNFRGFDLTHRAVPPMEGPLKPNTALDEAPRVLTLPDVDNLVATAGGLLCSSGAELLTLEARVSADGAPGLAIEGRRTFAAEISCLAADGEGGLAIGLDGEGIVIAGGKHDGKAVADLGGAKLVCATAAAFLDPDTLLAASGSRENPASAWKRDLMSHGQSGSLWIVDLAEPAKAVRIADRLAFPSGVAAGSGGRLLVSEAWRHRVLAFDMRGGEPLVMLSDLPAYPGRIVAATGGGFWLALFAPRNSLVEFVLLEKGYRQRMMEEVEPDYWIAPSLLAGRSFLEPIQGGARKKLNMLKPWSPSWSYGLVARCDEAMRPLASAHSRADGAVHGVTSLCEREGTLYAGAKGAGVVVALKADETVGGSV
jgi:NHL repeat